LVQGPSSFDTDRESSAAGRGEELRNAPRFTLLIRAAKLIADGREFLCILRDASASGFKARLFAPLPPHDELALELGNGDRFSVEQVWARDDYAGFRFRDQVAVERLLDETHGAFPKRQVRLRVDLDGLLHSGGETVRVGLHDISQQGASISSDKWLLMNELVRIETGITQPLFAKVRWRNHPRYGLIFEQTFKLDELGQLIAPLQDASSVERMTDRAAVRQTGHATGSAGSHDSATSLD
jgi:hypothetical protein